MADRRLASLDSAILTAGIEEEKTKASVNPVELEREAFFSRCGGKDALRIQVDEISSRRRLMTWLGVAASALFVGVAALAVFPKQWNIKATVWTWAATASFPKYLR